MEEKSTDSTTKNPFDVVKERLTTRMEILEYFSPTRSTWSRGLLTMMIADLDAAMKEDNFVVSNMSRIAEFVRFVQMLDEVAVLKSLTGTESQYLMDLTSVCRNYRNLISFQGQDGTRQTLNKLLDRLSTAASGRITLMEANQLMREVLVEYKRLLSFKPGIVEISEMYLEQLDDYFANRPNDGAYSYTDASPSKGKEEQK